MKKRIGVIMGGFTPERHISLESGRNVYSKLIASVKYDPLPLFLSGSMQAHRIFTLPTFLLLKDNADDIHDFLLHPAKFRELEALLTPIRAEALGITKVYAKGAIFKPEELTYQALKERIDFIFIALHGRPGEDGTLQMILEQYDIPYNGSGIETTALTIDKYATNQFLIQKGFYAAKQLIITQKKWNHNQIACIDAIEKNFSYPMIAKPVDDGCSTGVTKINNRSMLIAYASASFQIQQKNPCDVVQTIGLQEKSSMVPQERFLLEDFIKKDTAVLHFLETTTGLLTHIGDNGETIYEVFEPSEVLAADSILSLAEKFLAGAGHNITPARFHADAKTSVTISQMVRAQLAKVAQVLNVQGYARIDAFVKIYPHQKVEIWVIEINALPAMTPATCIFHQCALNGYTPFDFIDAIIQYGFKKTHFTTSSPSGILDKCIKKNY
ncbi:D-alanine--D-alanine ligase family protein [Candidatus Cardinium hertigii]|jgi:D-alanine-D-alanine ligase|uniref:D-alanine--D-alanine ligase n=1 Tax=Candidatus Cardinium hertigii TaxID=247481 RepID=A0A3N2QDB6_9BACT|nr:hypothetical protein [Candidatus Cardinium hertigii]ROT47805.1 hypothetical protein EDM02_00310 [Candidatus Cardinium hertigii]